MRARIAGGDMTVRSRPGEGVRIEVRAPISAERSARRFCRENQVSA
jgi:hypothetical protein